MQNVKGHFHNKSLKLFTLEVESHSRRRVRYLTLQRKVRDRYARGQFNPWFSFFLSISSFFFSPSFFPLSSPLLKIFFPPKTKLRGYSTGYRLVIIIVTVFEKRGNFAQNVESCLELVKFTCHICFKYKYLWNRMRY